MRFFKQLLLKLKRTGGHAAFGVLLGVLVILHAGLPSYAQAVWVAPEGTVTAGAAIVMDADTETVLWGSNIYEQCYPASITKIMTGLLVLENCDLDEMVTITGDSVYGLESGAVTAGLSEGDEVSVRDLLYATLFRSAADSSNALAIHVAGSVDDFAVMMTRRAQELGCTATVFKNPSGLTDSEHVTTAYDLALIGKACFDNPVFMEIESSEEYKMGPTAKYPGGLTVAVGHKMVKSGTKYTDERVVGGKTGFITASGNTLITFAESEGRRLVAVVLKDKNPDHYLDTKLLLDFGFANFENAKIEDPVARYHAAERLKTDKIAEGADCHILAAGPAIVTVPIGADLEDLTVGYEYNMPEDAPELAAARMVFHYADVRNGSVYLLNDRESELMIDGVDPENEEEAGSSGALHIPMKTALIIAGIIGLILAVIALIFAHRVSVRNEEARREAFRERQRRRLKDMHMSEESFQEMVEARKHHQVNEEESAEEASEPVPDDGASEDQ